MLDIVHLCVDNTEYEYGEGHSRLLGKNIEYEK